MPGTDVPQLATSSTTPTAPGAAPDAAPAGSPAPAPAPAAGVNIAARILLVDDSPSNQQLISFFLQKAGATVATAENGRVACEAVQQASGSGQPFDLVLMDMQMPELNGYGATSRIRAQGFDLPVIALTGDALPGDREKCIRAGCTDYLSKPASRAQVLEMVLKHLPAKDGAKPMRPEAAAAAAAAAVGAPAAVEHPADGKLRSSLAGDPETMPFVETFVRSLPQQVAQVLALGKEGELPALATALHGIKGTAGLYGFLPLADAARALEEQVRGGGAPAGDALVRACEELATLARTIDGYDAAGEQPGAAAATAGTDTIAGAQAGTPSGAPFGAASSTRTVLVVDDMPIIRDPVAASLRAAGYKTICAGNGREAVETIRMGHRIDLILLDVLMPGMNGLAFLEYLRNELKDTRTPVILLTAAEGRKDVLAAAKLGISGYLLKSKFSLKELLVRVKKQFDSMPVPAPVAPPKAA